jgi:hypothetical protein
MSDAAINQMIREVLAEELAKLLPGAAGATHNIQHETVRITSSADLNAFARRIVAMCDNTEERRNLDEGRLVFELAESSSSTSQARSSTRQPSAGPVHTIDKGFVSERHIDNLGKDVKRVIVGKAVRMTPLARDRARQRGIIIERMEP